MRKRVERGQHMLKDVLWEHAEPALSERKHREHLAGSIVAAIPFGEAPWLPGGPATAGTQATMIGGIVMAKKIAIGTAFVVALAAVTWLNMRDEPDPAPTISQPTAQPAAPASIVPEAVPPPPVVAAESAPELATQAPIESEEDIEAVRPASLSGRITSEDGSPIPAAVAILEVARDGNRDDIAKRVEVKANEDGAYRIPGIDVFGKAIAYASADGFVMDFRTVDIVEGMQKAHVDFLLGTAMYYVAGYVRTQSRQPIPGASVDTMYYGYDEAGLEVTAATGRTTGNIGGIKLKFAVTDSRGHFKLGMPNDGLCDLRVVKEGYGPAFYPRIPAGTDDANLVLLAGGAIEGRVMWDDGTPAARQAVIARGEVLPGGLEASEVRIQKLPATPATTVTDDEGFYRIDGLGEDYTYTVAVPGEDGDDDIALLPTTHGLRVIAEMMAGFNRDITGESIVAARKDDVRVRSGQTTRGIDLTLGADRNGIVFGRVTDRTSGKPVCPVAIVASSTDAEGTGLRAAMRGSHGGTGVTDLDGRYAITVANLERRVALNIGHSFMTEGGSAWEQPEDVAKVVELGPGDSVEVDLEVDAPVTVPVRYVNTDGLPREGVLAAMRGAGRGGGCGGRLISGADGLVEFHGIRPGTRLEAIAWVEVGSELRTIGVSEPFTGEPGQTMDEVRVVCRDNGSITGALAFSDGQAAANAQVVGAAMQASGAVTPIEGVIETDANGAFVLDSALPEGMYPMVALGFIGGEPALPYSVEIANVEIGAGAMTDLGVLTVSVEKDVSRVLEAAGWDRRSNEAIAAVYTPEWLPTVANPGHILKAGMALYDVGRYEDALTVFRHMHQVASPESLYTAMGSVWEGQMLDLLGRRQEAVRVYSGVAAMGSDSLVRHDQFGLAYKPSEYAAERIEQPFQRVENLE